MTIDQQIEKIARLPLDEGAELNSWLKISDQGPDSAIDLNDEASELKR